MWPALFAVGESLWVHSSSLTPRLKATMEGGSLYHVTGGAWRLGEVKSNLEKIPHSVACAISFDFSTK